MNILDPLQFLARLEKATGRKFPVPPPEGPDDDCPICRALGMRDGPEEGVIEIDGAQVMTIITDPSAVRRRRRRRRR